MAKHNFKTFFQKAQMWEKFSVVCSWHGFLDLILLVILFFYAKSITLKIISGLEIIQNYDIVKISQALPTERIPVFTLPSNYPDADMIQPHKVTISTSTIIVITQMSMIVLLTIYRKCRYKSSITRVYFLIYPSVVDPGFPIGGRGPHTGGCDPRGGYVLKILHVKMKESGPVGGCVPSAPP